VRELGPIPDVAFMLHTGDNARSTNFNLYDLGEEEAAADTRPPPNAWATEPQPPPDASKRNVPLPVRAGHPPCSGLMTQGKRQGSVAQAARGGEQRMGCGADIRVL
jgi:hypothetical protein